MGLAAAASAAPLPRAPHPRLLHRGVAPRAASVPSPSSSPSSAAAAPVYAPTPRDRPLRTPHSGYHFDGTVRPFFEGWYFKVAIPEQRQSFCFMYSVENPLFRDGMTDLDRLVYGPRFTGVGAQILGADDKYICQFSDKSNDFWGSRHELMLGNTFVPNKDSTPPEGEVPPQEFSNRVLEGFQVTPIWHQGFIRDDGRLAPDARIPVSAVQERETKEGGGAKTADEITEKYGLEFGLWKIFSSKEEEQDGAGEGKKKKSRTEQAKELLAKYGGAYLATSITLSLISFALCYALISAGVDVQDLLGKVGIATGETGGKVGTFALAYAAHKAASPIRFPPTVALTPVVASWIGKIRKGGD